jgi:hypothetical protein
MVVNVSRVAMNTLGNRARANLARLSQRLLNWTDTKRRHCGFFGLPSLVGRSVCNWSAGDYPLSRLHRLDARRNNRSRWLVLIVLQCLWMPLCERLPLLLLLNIHTMGNRARANLASVSQRYLNWRILTETKRQHSGARLPSLVGRLRGNYGWCGGDYRLARLHRLNARRNNRSRRLVLIVLHCLLMPLFECLHLLLSLFLVTALNRLTCRATHTTANVLAAVIMAKNIPRTITMWHRTLLLFTLRNVLPQTLHTCTV